MPISTTVFRAIKSGDVHYAQPFKAYKSYKLTSLCLFLRTVCGRVCGNMPSDARTDGRVKIVTPKLSYNFFDEVISDELSIFF